MMHCFGATTWVNLENVLLSENRHRRSQIVWLHLCEITRIDQSLETFADWWYQGLGGRRKGRQPLKIGLGFPSEVRRMHWR